MALSRPAEPAWRRFARLGARERNALAGACTLLARARFDLARRSMRDILDELAMPPEGTAPGADQLELLSWAIAAAATRVPWRADCLIRAMAAARWLRRHDLGWQFHIGVRRAGNGMLEAHAWLESGGTIVTGSLPDLDTFKPIPLGEFNRLSVPLR